MVFLGAVVWGVGPAVPRDHDPVLTPSPMRAFTPDLLPKQVALAVVEQLTGAPNPYPKSLKKSLVAPDGVEKSSGGGPRPKKMELPLIGSPGAIARIRRTHEKRAAERKHKKQSGARWPRCRGAAGWDARHSPP